jgi:SAM-dependent methyltransferase
MDPSEAHCSVCFGPASADAGRETAVVRSNVRAFKQEQFPVWRCEKCLSIHATREVDLARYYADYPFHAGKLGWIAIFCFDNLLRRLRRAGLKKSHRILDYGCGSGILVEYLRRRGYDGAVGYDACSPTHHDPKLLEATYDCIVSQDVIEHVAKPFELLSLFDRLCAPGAIVSIGTPNAEAIDLARPNDFVHTLHQPYHVCILSKRALLTAGQTLGWELQRYDPKQYSNLRLPCLNQRFFLRYVRCFGDTMDVVFEKVPFRWGLVSPRISTTPTGRFAGTISSSALTSSRGRAAEPSSTRCAAGSR